MFLRAYVELNLPIAEVEAALLRTPTDWIPGLASSAEEHGDQLLAEVGFPVSGLQVGKQVEIELGAPVRTSGRTWLPVIWRATGPLMSTRSGSTDATSPARLRLSPW